MGQFQIGRLLIELPVSVEQRGERCEIACVGLPDLYVV